MFTPNTIVLLFKAGATDKFGQNTYPAIGVTVVCAITKLDPKIQKTPVRSVESASRGEADDIVETATILFDPSIGIQPLDKVQAYGYSLRCIRASPQISTTGTLDFYECAFEAI